MSTTLSNAVAQSLLLDAIDPPDDPNRQAIDAARLGALADDLAANGQLQAIGVAGPDAAGRYVIGWGHRRFLAAQLLRWPRILAMVYPPGTDLEDVKWSENGSREDLNPIEEARVCKRWRDRQMPVVEISRRMRHTTAWVQERLECLDWPADLRDGVERGVIKLAVARELYAVDHDGYRKQLVDEVIRTGATARTVVAWVSAYAADRERIIQNTITIEEIAANRQRYVVKVICELNGEEVPLEQAVTIRCCRSCAKELFDAMKSAEPA